MLVLNVIKFEMGKGVGGRLRPLLSPGRLLDPVVYIEFISGTEIQVISIINRAAGSSLDKMSLETYLAKGI